VASREVIQVDSSDFGHLRNALEDALFRDGPAVFPTKAPKRGAFSEQIPTDAALIIESSGSTSRPKRIWHRVSSLLHAADQSNDSLGPPGVWWNVLPAHYIAGLMVLVRALQSNSTVIASLSTPTLQTELVRFDNAASSDSPNSPRYVSLVPKQLEDLVDAAERDSTVNTALQRFSRILVGGQLVPNALLERAHELGLTVTKTYGSAETAGGCVWDGKPLRETVVDIHQGRVAVAGPMLAGGYLSDPERTAASFHTWGGTRWFLSDDCGELVDGRLSVTGRIDRTIISGGVKINLDEVENLLTQEYSDQELAVVGVADRKWGQALAVMMSTATNRERLQRLLRKTFGPAARVTGVYSISPFPRLDSGKLDRVRLEKLASGAQNAGGDQ